MCIYKFKARIKKLIMASFLSAQFKGNASLKISYPGKKFNAEIKDKRKKFKSERIKTVKMMTLHLRNELSEGKIKREIW